MNSRRLMQSAPGLILAGMDHPPRLVLRQYPCFDVIDGSVLHPQWGRSPSANLMQDGLLLRLLTAAAGPQQRCRPAAVASGYQGAAGTMLPVGCNGHRINHRDA
jgi:hypothetical protein